MEKNEFGEFVRALRQNRIYFDRRKGWCSWTREVLAARTRPRTPNPHEAGLTKDQVRHIENGNLKHLNSQRHVEPLARAFELNPIQKADFYGKAGLYYSVEQNPPDRVFLRGLLSQLGHPASIRNPLWDFVAFNAYHRELFGYSLADINLLNEGELGPNLLRVLFDLHSYTQEVRKGPNWRVNSVRTFRTSSFPYIQTKRYKQIIDCMISNQDFENAWLQTEQEPAQQSYRDAEKHRPFQRVIHRKYGEIKFVSLRIPQIYMGRHMDISVYVPLTSSEAAYSNLRDEVGENVVHFFDERSLD